MSGRAWCAAMTERPTLAALRNGRSPARSRSIGRTRVSCAASAHAGLEVARDVERAGEVVRGPGGDDRERHVRRSRRARRPGRSTRRRPRPRAGRGARPRRPAAAASMARPPSSGSKTWTATSAPASRSSAAMRPPSVPPPDAAFVTRATRMAADHAHIVRGPCATPPRRRRPPRPRNPARAARCARCCAAARSARRIARADLRLYRLVRSAARPPALERRRALLAPGRARGGVARARRCSARRSTARGAARWGRALASVVGDVPAQHRDQGRRPARRGRRSTTCPR